jgi:pimeloyl-ACP methyl ester carboxylesterase
VAALCRLVLAAQRDALLYHRDFAACDNYRHGLEAAARVTAPATLILGTRDQMTSPKAAGDIATALKARVERVEAGHVLMAEAPDATLNALRRNLA